MNLAIAWIDAIKIWFQEYFEAQKLKKLIILKEWKGRYCTVLLLDSNIQGCRAVYRVIPHDRKNAEDWVVQLFHLAEFRARVDGIGFNRNGYEYNSHVAHAKKNNYSRRQSPEYRVSVHRVLRTGRSRLWVAIDCDLEDNVYNQSAILAVLFPSRVIAYILLNHIKNISNPYHFSWQEQMIEVDWIGLLEISSKRIINEKHNLHAVIIKRADRREFWNY